MGGDRRRNSLSFSFKPPKLRAPSGGGANGPPNFIVLQARSQAGRQATPDEVSVGRTDPFTGVKTETKESVQFRRYTIDEIRALGMSESFQAHNDYLTNLMETNPQKFQQSFAKATFNIPGVTGRDRGNILGFPTTMGDQDAIDINRSLNDMADRILRLRSGAQINDQEYSRLTGLLPSFKDLSVPIDENDGVTTFPTMRRALKNFNTELEGMKQRARLGGWYDPVVWGDVEQTGLANGGQPQGAIGSQIQGQPDKVSQLKQRYLAKYGHT